ncbi:MAG: DNA-processing protein DprA [Polyangiaceae bacterium]|nr:DNA-processing protein DprA [Polyangiaceae bacterium]
MHTTIVLQPDHPSYPASLYVLGKPDKPPPTLYLRGTLPLQPAVAIVGRRAASREAAAFTRSLVHDLAGADLSIWSGGAVGVDAAAHLAALEAGTPTVVVMGAGLDCPYPPEHVRLYERILDTGGALLSRLPDPYPPRPFNFLARNQILAALTLATIVVEAGLRSGARSTAAWARRLGRPLCVVPHAPWSHAGAGCAEELARGARAVTSAADVLNTLGLPPPSKNRSMSHPTTLSGQARLSFPATMGEPDQVLLHAVRQTAPSPNLELGTFEQTVLSAIGYEPMHIDVICDTVGAPLPAVVGALLTLTLQTVVVEGPAGCYRRGVR